MAGDEIAEFLRRAAARREEQLRRQQQGAPQSPPPPPQAPAPRQPISRATDVSSPYDDPIVEAEVIPEPPRKPPPQQPKVQNREPKPPRKRQSIQPATPSRRVAEVEKSVEARVHQKFDHDLGQDLGEAKGDAAGKTTSVVTHDTMSPVVQRIRAMLASSQDIKATFIVAEILRRPTLD